MSGFKQTNLDYAGLRIIIGGTLVGYTGVSEV